MATDQPSALSKRRIETVLCVECRRPLGEWHDKDCGKGRMGAGRVSDSPPAYLERTVYIALPDVLTAILEIEREQYVHGMRCSDFKEALDAIREALR